VYPASFFFLTTSQYWIPGKCANKKLTQLRRFFVYFTKAKKNSGHNYLLFHRIVANYNVKNKMD